MITTHKQDKAPFLPTTITLQCESQAEVDAICGIFNSALIMEAVRAVYELPDLKPYQGLIDLKLDKGIFKLNDRIRSMR